MSTALDPVIFFPPEISLKIFYYLDKTDLGRCCQMNSQWNALASDNTLWVDISKKIFNGTIPTAPNIKKFIYDLEPFKLKSNDEILDRIQSFLNRISLGQNGRFRCLLGIDSNCQAISLQIKGSQDRIDSMLMTDHYPSRSTDVTEDCIAPHGIGNGSCIPRFSPRAMVSKSYAISRMATIGERIINIIPDEGTFQATLTFPASVQTTMERRIEHIIKIKLDHFARRASLQNSIMYATAAAFAFLGGNAFGRYLDKS